MFSPYIADFPLPTPVRRSLLDWAGAVAQLSAPAFLLAYAYGDNSGRRAAARDQAPASERSRSKPDGWLDRPLISGSRVTLRIALTVALWIGALLGVNLYFGQGGRLSASNPLHWVAGT